MGRKKIQISRINDERNRQVRGLGWNGKWRESSLKGAGIFFERRRFKIPKSWCQKNCDLPVLATKCLSPSPPTSDIPYPLTLVLKEINTLSCDSPHSVHQHFSYQQIMTAAPIIFRTRPLSKKIPAPLAWQDGLSLLKVYNPILKDAYIFFPGPLQNGL